MSRSDAKIAYCSTHDNHFILGSECGYCIMDNKAGKRMTDTDRLPLTPQAEALIEAAVAWDELPDIYRGGKLRSAVRAYLATQQPKGVRPETLPPGTLFTWPDGSGELMLLQGKELMWWNVRSDVGPVTFSPDDLVIPLEES